MACLRHGLCDPFPSTPLRTPLDSFLVTRLSSNWLPDFPNDVEDRCGCPHPAYLTIPFHRSSLSHFALYAALPHSLVGRCSHDYYCDSVTVGLASCRPSHVPSSRNGRERRRLPIHALECVQYASLVGQSVTQANVEPAPPDDIGVQTCYRRMCGPPLGIGVQAV
jgi:hypothetical protein